MYAIIKTGGKQYRVALGDKLRVEKLAAAAGESVQLPTLLFGQGDGVDGVNMMASATVLAHGRGEKVRVFKMKRRKDYRRTQGHRQPYTEIEITSLGGKSTSASAAKKATANEGGR